MRCCSIYILFLSIMLAICPIPTHAAEQIQESTVYHATKFDAKKAKKNGSITYKKTGNGILAICKNCVDGRSGFGRMLRCKKT